MIPTMLFVVFLCLADCATSEVAQKGKYMSAPWTPLISLPNEPIPQLNISMVKEQVRMHKLKGVTHVWVNGGMAQWTTLTMDERKAVAEAWVRENRAQGAGMYIMIHVGSQSLSDAVTMARHAQAIGADGIAVIPPYNPSFSSLSTMVKGLKIIADSCSLPFWYYHIPGSTGYNIRIHDLLIAARDQIPTFAGVKFVSKDLDDFVESSNFMGGKYEIFWAPEPKLQAMPFGATKFVLAECYYAPYIERTLVAYLSGDAKKAEELQLVRDKIGHAVSSGGKDVMKMLGVDLGPRRLPQNDLSEEKYWEIYNNLYDLGFFNQQQFFDREARKNMRS